MNRILLTLLVSVLTGCASIQYYAQAVHGHFSLLETRVPIGEYLAAHPEDKKKLLLLEAARDYAWQQLALPDNQSYRSIAAWPSQHAVWTVVATPELDVTPVSWCFLVVGCTSYRGFYDEQAARAFAGELEAQGFDVLVGGVAAYSTLGWFDDPLPQAMLDAPVYDIVELMFHELAHQVVYVKDDSGFNEAYATAVAQAGTLAWLRSAGLPQDGYRQSLRQQQRLNRLLLEARRELSVRYRDASSVQCRRSAKQRILGSLQRDIARLVAAGELAPAYRRWLQQPLNNAHLALAATYHELVPAYRRLLRDSGDDYAAFHQRVQVLAAMPRSARRAALSGRMEEND